MLNAILNENVEADYSEMHYDDLAGASAVASADTCIGNCCSSSSSSKTEPTPT